ncbi:hypothetical protein niasHS_003786 [Heterodera schachtii]|uniref:Uncharacterized protein n=2 Tax=Heterodera TaxID=34509 RepID=A0ABD2KWK1_9BILA
MTTPKIPAEIARITVEKVLPTHFAKSRGPGRPVFELVPAKGGEILADYVLFEETMKKAKVPWLCFDKMTSQERRILTAHLRAIRDRKLSYKCPETAQPVKSLSQLLFHGKCCGEGCRHCPYELEACVEKKKRSLIWNGAFYT